MCHVFDIGNDSRSSFSHFSSLPLLMDISDIRDSLAPRAVNLLLRELLILYRCATLVSPRSGSRNQPKSERKKTEKKGLKKVA